MRFFMNDFTIGNPGSIGLLNPEDLNFFYYDVSRNSLDGWASCCEWNCDIEDFIKGNKLRIEVCDAKYIPGSVDSGTILFTIDPMDSGSKADALLRHLRNAFSHFRINRNGDNYIMSDYSNGINKHTMRGYINADLLKTLIFKLYSQNQEKQDSYDPNKDLYDEYYQQQ